MRELEVMSPSNIFAASSFLPSGENRNRQTEEPCNWGTSKEAISRGAKGPGGGWSGVREGAGVFFRGRISTPGTVQSLTRVAFSPPPTGSTSDSAAARVLPSGEKAARATRRERP